MTYAPAFGSYSIPRGINVASVAMARVVPSAKTPRYDGARTLNGMLELKRFSVQGKLIRPLGNNTNNYLRTLLDGLKAGLAQGPANFVIEPDRYWRQCQAEGYTDTYEATGYMNFVEVSCEIVTGDPFSYDTTGQTGSRALSIPGQTLTVSNGGNAPGSPRLSLTAGATGTLSATVTNQTTGDVFTLFGAVTSGDIIIVDSLLETVTRGGVDVTLLFDGQFQRLAAGSNVFRFDWTSGNLSNAAIAWNNRFY